MAEQTQTPLIGPLKQRGWHEIIRFRPISNTPHATLVVTRRGRLAGIIPAGDRRVLSDYITWPYDFREVDMRERLLLITQRLDSCDAGYAFDAALSLAYQVERPERVALELEDALSELEQVLAQSMRVTARSFGVEQTKALEANLREALLYGDVLRARLAALGLGLRRADVAVDLDAQARARAEALRAHMRDRPLRARLAIASLDPSCTFETLVGGSYRLTSRVLTDTPAEFYETSVQEPIMRTLQRIGIAFAPQQYEAAAESMADALRHDALLQAELAAAEIELVRPTVQIQPDRQMVIAAQRVLPAPTEPLASKQGRRAPALLTDHAAAPGGSEDRPPWADLGSMFGRTAPALPAGEPRDQASLEEAPSWAAPALSTGEPEGEEAPSWATPPVYDAAGAIEHDTPPWIAADIQLAGDDADAPDERHDTSVVAPIVADEPPLAAPEPAIDHQQIVRWITLLKADDPALYKLWTLEIIDQPQMLPTILSALTSDAAALALAEDRHYQQALMLALAEGGERSVQAAEQAAPPAAEPGEIEGVAAPSAADEAPPDWLSLRQSWSDQGGAS